MQNDYSLISPTSFRIDKYLVNEIENFNSQIRFFNGGAEGPDDKLIRNIVYSVANDYEHNLMGFGQLDPRRFAESWKYDAAFLRRRVENPYQVTSKFSEEEASAYRSALAAGEKPPKSLGHVWDTRLENALYILSDCSISFDRYGETMRDVNGVKQKVEVATHAAFTLFSSLSFVTTGHNKTIYIYTLNEAFEHSLTRYYIRGEKNSLLVLRREGLDSLYLYLVNLKTNLALGEKWRTTPGTLPDFEYLCNMAGIRALTKDGRAVPMKERKKQLGAALARITAETELSVKVEWVRGDGARDCYVPVLDFGTEEVLGTQNGKGMKTMVGIEEKKIIIHQIIKKNLLDMYRKVTGLEIFLPGERERFEAWAVDKNRDMEEKKTALRMALISLYQQLPKKADQIVTRFFDSLNGRSPRQFGETVARFRIYSDEEDKHGSGGQS